MTYGIGVLPHGRNKKIMRLLITGGLGYLGGRLANHLLDHGHKVYLGTRKRLKSINEPLSGTTTVQMNWMDTNSLEMATKGIDTVVHSAGMAADACSENPSGAFEVNGLYTEMLLEAAINSQVRRFIYLSTVHVYRSPLTGILDETVRTTNIHPYATSKLEGEKKVLYAQEIGNIQGIVLRISNGCGHPVFPDTECWHLIINDLCRQAVEKKSLILHSDSSIQRNFITMSNICKGIEHFLKLSQSSLEKSPFNLCSKKSHSLKQIALLVSARSKEILGYEVEIFCKSNEGEGKNNRELQLSSKKTEETGLNLQENLLQEIDNTLLFCKSHFSSAV